MNADSKRANQIRAALRREFQEAACNEMHVAKLRYEMSGLNHRHRLNEDKACVWCFYGTDAYTQPLDVILAETREYERQIGMLITGVLRIVSVTTDRGR